MEYILYILCYIFNILYINYWLSKLYSKECEIFAHEAYKVYKMKIIMETLLNYIIYTMHLNRKQPHNIRQTD